MIKRHENISLKGYNSFGVEATAAALIEFGTAGELCEILSHDVAGKPWMILSGGNNLLFVEDYPGTMLHPVGKGISITQEDGQSVMVHVEGGEEWDDVVAWCAGRGLWGIENLSLIPGYAGAAPVQNIGAYGTELKDVIDTVEIVLTDSLAQRKLTAAECRFGYRDSIFKHELKGEAVITAINLKLTRNGEPNLSYAQLQNAMWKSGGTTIQDVRNCVIAIRRAKLPDPKETGNAGSFFKNPVINADRLPYMKSKFPDMPSYPTSDENFVKVAAGWLIEKAGWKGYKHGHVGVHHDQALVLVNFGEATGMEILRLARTIQSDVMAKFAIKLEMEVNIPYHIPNQ